MTEQARAIPDRMITPSMWKISNTIIGESGTSWRENHVQAVRNPVGSMAIRVDRRRKRDGVTLFVASAFVYDTEEGVLTVHRHEVYDDDSEGPQLEPFSRRFIIDPSPGSVLELQKDKAEDPIGFRDSMSVLLEIKRAKSSCDPFVPGLAKGSLRFIFDAVANDTSPEASPEAYFHSEILAAFTK